MEGAATSVMNGQVRSASVCCTYVLGDQKDATDRFGGEVTGMRLHWSQGCRVESFYFVA